MQKSVVSWKIQKEKHNIRVSKEYNQDFSAAGQTISAKCVDDFTRTNRVFGVGVDFDL